MSPWLPRSTNTPESPPARDSLFQYGWVLPQVCKHGLRRHVYFGAIRREDARDVFAFWQDARRGAVARVAHHEGRLAGSTIEAPVAVYRHDTRRGDKGYLFIQHGSYQYLQASHNRSEAALRVVALGRKNFLFVGHPKAGNHLAALYTVVASADAHGVDPLAYLTDILMRLDSTPDDQLDSLLPLNWAPSPD